MFKAFIHRRQVLIKSHMERFVECEETIKLEKTMHLKQLQHHNKQSSESQTQLNSNIFKTCNPLWPSKTYFCAYPLRRPEAGSRD